MEQVSLPAPARSVARGELARFQHDLCILSKRYALLYPESCVATADFLEKEFGKYEPFPWLPQRDQDILEIEWESAKPGADEKLNERFEKRLKALRLQAKGQRDRLAQRLLPADSLAKVIDFCKGQNDHYISQNLFTKWGGRKEKNLAGLTCCWVDLDYYKNDSLMYLDDDVEAIDRILSISADHPPSQIIRSGRGLLVRWIFDDFLPPQALPRWKHVQKALIAKFQDVGVDAGAIDCSRIFRVLGSRNAKSGKEVKQIHAGCFTNFDQLANMLLPRRRLPQGDRQIAIDFRKKIAKERAAKEKKKAAEVAVKVIKKAGVGARITGGWCAGVIQDVFTLARLRSGEEGHRELCVFLILNFKLIGGWRPTREEFEMETRQVARVVVGGDKNFEEEALGAVSGVLNGPRYRYSRATLIKLLKLTEDEQSEMKVLKTTLEVVRKKRIVGGLEAAVQMLAGGKNKKEVAKELGVGLSTIQRWASQARTGATHT